MKIGVEKEGKCKRAETQVVITKENDRREMYCGEKEVFL